MAPVGIISSGRTDQYIFTRATVNVEIYRDEYFVSHAKLFKCVISKNFLQMDNNVRLHENT